MKEYSFRDAQLFFDTIRSKGFEVYALAPDTFQRPDGVMIDPQELPSAHVELPIRDIDCTFLAKANDPQSPADILPALYHSYEKHKTVHPFIQYGNIRCELRGMKIGKNSVTFHIRTGTKDGVEQVKEVHSLDGTTQQILDAVKGEVPRDIRNMLGLSFPDWY